jgi:hypothetical protein
MLRSASFWSTKKQMQTSKSVGAQAGEGFPPAPITRRRLGIFVLVGMAGVLVVLVGWYYYVGTRTIPSSGGLYFFSRLVIPVQRFAQADPRWSDDELGTTASTMGEAGCAVSSAAMVLAFYGQDIDPGRLNTFLSDNGGYTPQGWLYWEKAADFHPGLARHAYEDLPSYFLIDSNLEHGNPVIIRIRLPNGITHFVVIVGKAGFDYLIQDPASGGANGVYPLRSLAPQIEALRFYERVSPPAVLP